MKSIINLSILFIAMTTTIQAQINLQEETAVKSILSTLQEGWNTKSGQTFASVFADIHDYVVINGMYFPSWQREINANVHQGIFNALYKNVDVEIKLDKIKPLGKDLLLVHAFGGKYEHGKTAPENPDGVISMIVEKQGPDWKIISFHNCNIEVSFDPAEANRSPVPLSVMYRNWYN